MGKDWTPGPWNAFTDSARRVWLIIARGDPNFGPAIAVDREDDANLIAAAPDLYAALTNVRQWLGDDLFTTFDVYRERAEQSCREMDAALAKARGEQP